MASFASWHEHHAAALAGVQRVDTIVAHCLLETYSVLTRLPAPHRIDAQVAATYIRLAFGNRPLVALSATEQRKLVATCASQGLSGGAVYDALIGATCARGGVRLLTLDTRARQTYAILGVDHEVVA